jgi:hypothetical protein
MKKMEKLWKCNLPMFVEEEELDLIKLRVPWKLWAKGDFDDEIRCRDLYNEHEKALKLIRKVEFKMNEEQMRFMKEDPGNPDIRQEFEVVNIVKILN